MSVNAPELLRELKALRKGRGLMATRIDERVGPALRTACRILGTDGSVEMRRKITDALSTWATGLPADLRIAVAAAFGLHPDARHVYYQDRLRWAAQQLCRDERTARRRVDDGLGALAELAVGSAAATAAPLNARRAGWQTVGLWVTMSLDLPNPEAFEYRRIVASQDGVDELDLCLTLTADPADSTAYREVELDIFRGGTLVRWSRESGDRFAFALALPGPLRQGQMHDYAIRFRIPGGRVMHPHYVFIPKSCCELFDLSVRFDRAKRPRRVWKLSEAGRRDVEGPFPHRPTLPVDGAGGVHLTFRRLAPGLAYGMRWEEAGHPLVGRTDLSPGPSGPAIEPAAPARTGLVTRPRCETTRHGRDDESGYRRPSPAARAWRTAARVCAQPRCAV